MSHDQVQKQKEVVGEDEDERPVAGMQALGGCGGDPVLAQARNSSTTLPHTIGKGKIAMSYVHFTRDIELFHHVTIKGWTTDRFCNPSDLSNNVDELTKLGDALKSGDCKFVRLTDEQHAEIKQKYDADVAVGLVPHRKKRKDTGEKHGVSAKKHKQGHSEEDAENGESVSTPAHIEDEQLDPALMTPSGSGK